jgi:glycosyltransferase involved in cell wall biosynthesis
MMPAYNAEAYIGEAIQSILSQSYMQWELIIVDDGSTDHTVEIVEKYSDPRIKLVRQDNSGEAAARNTALRNIQGEFLAFLDADDLYLPHHLQSTVGYLLSHDQVDGVYTDGFYIDQAGNRLQTLSSRRRGPFEGNVFEEVVYSSNVFGPPVCVVLRTKLIHNHKLAFDEDITIGPDWDFFIKYAELANFKYIDQLTCLYRLHTNNISILTSLEKRALELGKCRINAMKIGNFKNCSVHVRVKVFYDLLINSMIGFPECQSDVTQWQEFTTLPKTEQARLFRLMASKADSRRDDSTYVRNWLNKSRQLNVSDWRSTLLWATFTVHPKLFDLIVKLRNYRQVDPRTIPPFADIKLSE